MRGWHWRWRLLFRTSRGADEAGGGARCVRGGSRRPGMPGRGGVDRWLHRCLLQRGAARVSRVDVGRRPARGRESPGTDGSWSIDRINVRQPGAGGCRRAYTLAVVDVSFISLRSSCDALPLPRARGPGSSRWSSRSSRPGAPTSRAASYGIRTATGGDRAGPGDRSKRRPCPARRRAFPAAGQAGNREFFVQLYIPSAPAQDSVQASEEGPDLSPSR